MSNQYSADIPKGFNVPKQVRLDSITGIQNEETLKDLGSGNNLAFKYYEGLKIYCKDEKTEYVWREVIGSETGLLTTHFVYPTYPSIDGIDYSGKSFNFFLVINGGTPANGSETKINSGTNTTVTGLGTIVSPYVINSTDTIADGSETKINEGDNITITGNGTQSTPYIINADLTDLGIVKTIDNEVIAPGQSLSIINNELTGKVLATKEYIESIIPTTPDGSETKVEAGDNVTITGTGTALNPYIVNSLASGKEITSSSLIITESEFSVNIETPIVSEILTLIVNSNYIGDDELGTESKPFKTIQAALDAYKGTGGKGTISDPTNPEQLGAIIEIKKGAGTYIFTGDFNYKDLKISMGEGAIISSTPIGYWLMDFNSFSSTTTHNPSIEFREGSYIVCNNNGFKLVGGDFAINTGNKKSLTIFGNSKETGLVLTGTSESDILFEVEGGLSGFLNGGYNHLQISAFISTERGRLLVIKGNGLVSYSNALITILNNPASVIITNTYPTIEIKNNGKLSIRNATIAQSKTPTVTYTQLFSMYDSASVDCIDTEIIGEAEYFAYNNSIANTATIKLDYCKMYLITSTSFADTISGVWSMVLTNNNMPNTNINSNNITIIPSSINTIGGEVIETLETYISKSAAVIAGLPKGAKFINKVDTTAGSFIAGLEYKILTIGTTDFTLIGASTNTIGLYYTATGAGTGTGTASLIKIDIVN